MGASGMGARIRNGQQITFGLAKRARIEESKPTPEITMFCSTKAYKGEDKGSLYLATGNNQSLIIFHYTKNNFEH